MRSSTIFSLLFSLLVIAVDAVVWLLVVLSSLRCGVVFVSVVFCLFLLFRFLLQVCKKIYMAVPGGVFALVWLFVVRFR